MKFGNELLERELWWFKSFFLNIFLIINVIIDVFIDEISEKSPAENIRELYSLLMQRKAFDNVGYGDIPLEHLMIRKSQRSPSLRLRFGRSDSRLPVGILFL